MEIIGIGGLIRRLSHFILFQNIQTLIHRLTRYNFYGIINIGSENTKPHELCSPVE
jgi:hypothetical protein